MRVRVRMKHVLCMVVIRRTRAFPPARRPLCLFLNVAGANTARPSPLHLLLAPHRRCLLSAAFDRYRKLSAARKQEVKLYAHPLYLFVGALQVLAGLAGVAASSLTPGYSV